MRLIGLLCLCIGHVAAVTTITCDVVSTCYICDEGAGGTCGVGGMFRSPITGFVQVNDCPAGSAVWTNTISSHNTWVGCSCMAGYYIDASLRSCNQCAAQKYSGVNASTCASCTACPADSYAMRPCNKSSNVVCSACTPQCAPGFYELRGCNATANRVCLPCPAGAYCAQGKQTPCSATCVAGKYQTAECTNATDTECSPCPANSYCIGGNATPCRQECGLGMNESTACTSSSNRVCSACGNLPPQATAVASKNCSWTCNEKYFQSQGSCSACPSNSWCSGNVKTACPNNTESTALSSGQDQCTCKAGFVSKDAGPCLKCQAGYRCPGGNASIECPANMVSLPGASAPGDCHCKPGYQLVNSACQMCPANVFCELGIRSACPSNSHSLEGSTNASACVCNPGFHGANCDECPANSYCPGTSARQPCVAHAISLPKSTNASACYCDTGYKGTANAECAECPEDSWCSNGASSACSTSCEVGLYIAASCTRSSDRVCAPCPDSSYCQQGVAAPCSQCPEGQCQVLPCDATADTACGACPNLVRESLTIANLAIDACACSSAAMADRLSTLYGTRVLPVACRSGETVVACEEFTCQCAFSRRLLQAETTLFSFVYRSQPKDVNIEDATQAISEVVPDAQVQDRRVYILSTNELVWTADLANEPEGGSPAGVAVGVVVVVALVAGLSWYFYKKKTKAVYQQVPAKEAATPGKTNSRFHIPRRMV